MSDLAHYRHMVDRAVLRSLFEVLSYDQQQAVLSDFLLRADGVQSSLEASVIPENEFDAFLAARAAWKAAMHECIALSALDAWQNAGTTCTEEAPASAEEIRAD